MLFFIILSIIGWRKLVQEAAGYKGSRYAGSSSNTRAIQVERYLNFCSKFKHRLQPYPCKIGMICLYISFLARTMKFSSIRNYLSAINDHFKYLGEGAINYENHKLKACLMGIRKT